MCGTKLSLLARNGSMWRFFCMQGEFYTVPPPHQEAQQGEICTERKAKIKRSDTRAHQAPCGGRRRVRGAWTRCRRPVRRANTGSRGQRQTNFAHNFPRSLFEIARKRCNSNDANSMFEKVVGELRAKLLCQRAWPQCRWAAAGPGRQHTDNKHRPIGRREACGARPRCRWVAAGPGRASRSIIPSRRLACGDLAGGPPPTGTHSGRASMRDDATPGTPAEPHAPAAQPPGHAKGAGTEVPAPCRLTQPLPRRGSGRMTVSPGDGDASTGTCRQRRPLPGQLHRSGRRSRCVRDAASGPAPRPGRRARRNRSSRQ